MSIIIVMFIIVRTFTVELFKYLCCDMPKIVFVLNTIKLTNPPKSRIIADIIVTYKLGCFISVVGKKKLKKKCTRDRQTSKEKTIPNEQIALIALLDNQCIGGCLDSRFLHY